MQSVTLYLSTAIVFLVIDVIALKTVIKPMFKTHLGDWLLDEPRMGPAAAFYLFYVFGVVVFASAPAMAAGDWTRAAWGGALLGALAYGTYEFTNYATLSRWNWQLVAFDFSWGILLTTVSALAGYFITRAVWGGP
ncbi:MAG: DUF2177 family protein [Pseudomonadota bacterium]